MKEVADVARPANSAFTRRRIFLAVKKGLLRASSAGMQGLCWQAAPARQLCLHWDSRFYKNTIKINHTHNRYHCPHKHFIIIWHSRSRECNESREFFKKVNLFKESLLEIRNEEAPFHVLPYLPFLYAHVES